MSSVLEMGDKAATVVIAQYQFIVDCSIKYLDKYSSENKRLYDDSRENILVALGYINTCSDNVCFLKSKN